MGIYRINNISGFGLALYNMIVWALVGDVIDYQEYLSGKREEGIVYATYSLARKLVQAIVGSIGGFALAAIGYQSGAATQTPEVAESIRTYNNCSTFSRICIWYIIS